MKSKNSLTFFYVSLCYWIVWLVGVMLTVIMTFGEAHNNSCFWEIVEPYNRTVLLFSLLPIIPLMFFSKISKAESEQKESLKIILAIDILLWLGYICAYVGLTGGV